MTVHMTVVMSHGAPEATDGWRVDDGCYARGSDRLLNLRKLCRFRRGGEALWRLCRRCVMPNSLRVRVMFSGRAGLGGW